MSVDLKLKDTVFLRTVYEINRNPEEFDHTEKGKVPAATQAIRVASGLGSEAVRYRMGEPNARGLEEAGLTVVHSAVPTESGYNQTSVELTEKGVERVHNAETSPIQSESSSGSSAEVEALRERIESLENHDLDDANVDTEMVLSEVRSLKESVSQIESRQEDILERIGRIEASDWGGLSDESAENMELLLQRGPAMMYAFNEILSIDIDQIVSGGAYSPGEVADIQEQIFTELAAASDSIRSDGSASAEGEQVSSNQ